MAYEFKLQRMVEFSETDMAGIVHFTNFFRYMEQTEHAFYRERGMSVVMGDAGRTISWPRVRAACDYRRPLRFEDRFEVHLLVRQKQAKSIAYTFLFRKLDGGDDAIVARGEMSVVCVSKDQDGNMQAIEIPRAIAERIDEAPPELFEED